MARILRILFTLVLCGWVCYQAGLFHEEGRKKFLDIFIEANIFWLLLSVGFIFILNSLSSIKWKMLLGACGDKLALWRLYVYYDIGQFFNLILPTSMGGDVVRIFLLGEYTGKKSHAVASVVVERFTGVVGMLIFAVFSMLLNFDKFNQKWLVLTLTACCSVAIALAWLILKKKSYRLSAFIPVKKYSFLEKIARKVVQVQDAIFEYSDNRMALFVALCNSFIFQFFAVLNVWVTARIFSDEISLMLCMAAVPIILFIMNIPLSIGGIGLMEFSYIFVFSLFDINPALSVSIALFFRVKSIIDALIGGFFYLFVRGGLDFGSSGLSKSDDTSLYDGGK